jgi:hypothetical protein
MQGVLELSEMGEAASRIGGFLTAILLLAPFRRSTWRIVDTLNEPHPRRYWREVVPDWIHDSDEENNDAIERSLAAKRPRAAFTSMHFQLEAIRPPLLLRLLSEMVKEGNDQPGHHLLAHHDIEKAFSSMDKGTELTPEQKAEPELSFIDVLSRSWSKPES